ncbi:hypothetical protein [uncultured Prochlorococcus sp.]|uniref:hypothetical protein n=1 Tax=uncultured Prochlorococcus sp. TaxID=159733 RepID=UPI002589EA1F|nr:hypothetical protein [uncultured Prochlorococcus sp.]
MKRLLFPLIATIALPNSVNAETFYLKCTTLKGRGNPDKPFKTFADPTVDNHQFTLNEDNQSAVYYLAEDGSSRKIDNVNFNQESIDMKYTKGKNYFGETIETISINRLTGGFVKETDIGSQLMRFEGQCKKSEPKKTLF